MAVTVSEHVKIECRIPVTRKPEFRDIVSFSRENKTKHILSE